MAKGTKPGAKPDAHEEVADAPPKKSKKKLIIIVVALVLLLAVGAVAALLLLKPAHPPEEANAEGHPNSEAEKIETPSAPPKFVELGTFTTNLVPEDGSDRFVQVVISLKISRPELEEQISASKPEILHRVNMMLQSKRPTELVSVEGKALLAEQIKVQIQHVLGLRKTAPPIGSAQTGLPPADPKVKGGLDEVLFTSFLIQ